MSDPPRPTVTLDPVRGEETGALAAMAARIWPAAYGAILPPGQIEYMLARIYAPDRLRRDLDEGVELHWVLRDGERLGFLGFGPVVPSAPCPLHKLYLLPESQGAGLGRAALDRLVDRLSASGASAVELRVNRHNRTAIAFYQKNGFETYAEDCRDIGGGFVMDDYLMRRHL